jgi:6-pyruvoyl-tetrahydropterin synthase related domain
MTASVDVAPLDQASAEQVPATNVRVPSHWGTRLRQVRWSTWANLAAVLGVTLVALTQLHPSLLLANTTTDGGDTGAHVMLPAFLKSNLLPHGHLTGWDPDWYDGFPLYTFYFPLPGLITVIFNALLPYNVAFKLVTVLGTLILPVCAWAFGRLAGLRDPGPAFLAAATLPFLFEPSFTIYGGNILSTLAGEFSYSLSLSVALLFLGVVAAGLRTGRYRAVAAVLFAATLLCHLIPAIFAAVGAGVWLLLDVDLARSLHRGVRGRLPRRRWSKRLVWLIVVGAVGGGLTAFWAVPFATGQAYTTNMGWTNIDGFPHLLFPASGRWVAASALVGVIAMVVRRNRVGLFIAVMGGLSAAAVCLDPQGKIYNVRFLPLWFLCLYLMAGYGLGELVTAVARWNRRRRLEHWVTALRQQLLEVGEISWRPGMRISRSPRPTPAGTSAGAVIGPLVALAAACLAVLPPLVLPASTMSDIGVTVGPDQPSAWAEWNYSGYERKPDYPEYRSVIAMMAKVGRTDGCGRSMWEYDPSENRFGTTMSLMLLPYWTNGCVDSMEGLLFESSTTTPFHFINQSELSVNPSDAVDSTAFQYEGLNVPLGIRHLQMLGVRYFLAASSTVEAAAARDPNLTQLASTGPWPTSYNGQSLDTTWKVYEVKQSALVRPLANRPIVWTGVTPAQSSWLGPAATWYDTPANWDVVPASGGPANWTREPASDTRPKVVPEPASTVSEVVQTDSSVSFHVDRTGTPVEVRVSYFPNWQAQGAEGPWRVAPNLMVVVPTSHQVTLTYGSTSGDRLADLVTLAAAVAVCALVVLAWRARRSAKRAAQNGRVRVRGEPGVSTR